MTRKIYIIRSVFLEKETLGNLFVVEGTKILFKCKTLELPYRDNQRNISCAPSGVYPIKFEYSPAFDEFLWELKNVQGRSEIKIHVANFFDQLRGCIAVGDQHIYINNDQFKDVRNSRNTLKRLHAALEGMEDTTIHIFGSPEKE